MLIPRFSIRFLLLLTTICAVFFFVVTLAVQGSQWATAISIAIAGLVLTMLVQAGTFGVAWALTSFFGVFRSAESATSPFASAKPPPQYIEPPMPEE
ncbi:MAG TPA: hypothetical protein QF564_22370 [Pirellulaceae bacterium]|nr:hypothetical protein [Pirellulaceae bacterium]